MKSNLLRLTLLLLLGLPLTTVVRAQEALPALTNATTAIVPATTFVSFPVKTFIENIVVDESGTLFVTSLEEGNIYRIGADGKPQVFAHIDGQVAGIAPGKKGEFYVDGWASDKTPTIWHLNKKGEVSKVVAPEGAQFLNGFSHLSKNRYLIADSYVGAIWEFDADTGKTTLWLKDALLGRSDEKSTYPAVNGLHVYKGTLYVSNTQQHLLLGIPLTEDGKPAGSPTVFVKDINLDDFAIDQDGNIYATTHIYNSVVRIAPDGKVTTIATLEQGVAGSTSAAFGHGKKDSLSLYITTNGGMSNPPAGGIQPGKIVRLDVGAKGLK